MAATALAVSSVDLPRSDRARTLKELEAKGKVVMCRLDELQSRQLEDSDSGMESSGSALPTGDRSSTGRSGYSYEEAGHRGGGAAPSGAGGNPLAGIGADVVAKLERRIARLEASPPVHGGIGPGPGHGHAGSGGTGERGAPLSEGSGSEGRLEEAEYAWGRRLEEVKAHLEQQISAVHNAFERRLDATQAELRASSHGGAEQRRRDLERFCGELRHELSGLRAMESSSVEPSEAGTRMSMMASQIFMMKIELSARVSMLEDTVARAELATIIPRLRAMEEMGVKKDYGSKVIDTHPRRTALQSSLSSSDNLAVPKTLIPAPPRTK